MTAADDSPLARERKLGPNADVGRVGPAVGCGRRPWGTPQAFRRAASADSIFTEYVAPMRSWRRLFRPAGVPAGRALVRAFVGSGGPSGVANSADRHGLGLGQAANGRVGGGCEELAAPGRAHPGEPTRTSRTRTSRTRASRPGRADPGEAAVTVTRKRQPAAICVVKNWSISDVRVSVMSASEMVGVPSPGCRP